MNTKYIHSFPWDIKNPNILHTTIKCCSCPNGEFWWEATRKCIKGEHRYTSWSSLVPLDWYKIYSLDVYVHFSLLGIESSHSGIHYVPWGKIIIGPIRYCQFPGRRDANGLGMVPRTIEDLWAIIEQRPCHTMGKKSAIAWDSDCTRSMICSSNSMSLAKGLTLTMTIYPRRSDIIKKVSYHCKYPVHGI